MRLVLRRNLTNDCSQCWLWIILKPLEAELQCAQHHHHPGLGLITKPWLWLWLHLDYGEVITIIITCRNILLWLQLLSYELQSSLQHINISFSKSSSAKQHLFSLNISPAMEKSFSTIVHWMLVFVNIGKLAWTKLVIILYKRGDNVTERLDILVQCEALTLSVNSYDFQGMIMITITITPKYVIDCNRNQPQPYHHHIKVSDSLVKM